MNIQFFNTKTRQKETFTPIKQNEVSMYSCGPTVYSTAHIGNMRTFVLNDLIKRSLTCNGFHVKHVMNITDVGHLISETGKDKMEEAAKRSQKTSKEIAEYYTQEFMNDLTKLNVIHADYYPRATEFIQEQINLIKKLEEKGHTYKTSDGIYFDTSTFETYGQLSGQSLDEKEEGARVEKNPEKKHGSDFALWKFSPKNEQRQMEWDSPWGIGFPGWHIECSAMSTALLGQPIDIHTGAIDLIPVHHENEIAQSVAATGLEYVHIWIHGEFVDLQNERMAKSDGNVVTVSNLEEKGFNPLAYRYLMFNTHYRSKLNFTFDALEAAQNALYNIRNTVRSWKAPTTQNTDILDRFTCAINDDLNTPQALAIMWELIKSNLESSQKAATLQKMDEFFGLNLTQWIANPLIIPSNITDLAQQRLQARKEKNWDESDRLRALINKHGYIIEDSSDGYTISEQ